MDGQLVDMQVRRADTRERVGPLDSALLDPRPGGDERKLDTLRHACRRAVAAAAQRKVHDNPEHMPWLAEYVVELRKHGTGEVLYTFREFAGGRL